MCIRDSGKYGSVGAYNGNLGYLNTGVVNSKLRWEKSHTLSLIHI